MKNKKAVIRKPCGPQVSGMTALFAFSVMLNLT